jgi:hypothetical protein
MPSKCSELDSIIISLSRSVLILKGVEITDAAMSERADCVMLNKGPFVLDAVRTLGDVLRRMEAHQEKKRSMMRLWT